MSKWGAIAGAAQAGGQALNTWLSFEMEKQKEQRLQSYADQRYQQQRADQLADKASDREYAQGVLSEERKYQEGRDAKKHEQALEVAQAKKGQNGKKERADFLKTVMDQEGKLLAHYHERQSDPSNPMSEDELKHFREAQDRYNQVKTEYNALTGGKVPEPSTVFDVKGALERMAGSTDEEMQANYESVRKQHGEQAANELRQAWESQSKTGILNEGNTQEEEGLLSKIIKESNPSYHPQYAVSEKQDKPADTGMTAKGSDKMAKRDSAVSAIKAIEKDFAGMEGGRIDDRQIPYYAEEIAKRHNISPQQAQMLILRIIENKKNYR